LDFILIHQNSTASLLCQAVALDLEVRKATEDLDRIKATQMPPEDIGPTACEKLDDRHRQYAESLELKMTRYTDTLNRLSQFDEVPRLASLFEVGEEAYEPASDPELPSTGSTWRRSDSDSESSGAAKLQALLKIHKLERRSLREEQAELRQWYTLVRALIFTLTSRDSELRFFENQHDDRLRQLEQEQQQSRRDLEEMSRLLHTAIPLRVPSPTPQSKIVLHNLEDEINHTVKGIVKDMVGPRLASCHENCKNTVKTYQESSYQEFWNEVSGPLMMSEAVALSLREKGIN
jgi:hypothetical protein